MESARSIIPAELAIIPNNLCKTGAVNVDGRCVVGGELSSASLGGSSPGCASYPVYLRTFVPYTSNASVASTDMRRLNAPLRSATAPLNVQAYKSGSR